MISAYGPGGVKLDVFEPSDIVTKSWQNTVILSGNAKIRGSWEGQEFEHYSRFMDVYAYRDSEWKLIASKITDHVKE